MPTYVYRCSEGHEFESFHKMFEDGPTICEVCGVGPVERVLFPVAVHFKGSGFYTTDYGRGNQSKREGNKDGDSAASSETSDTSSSSGESSSGGESGDSSGASGGSSGDSTDGKSEKKTAEA